MSVLLGICLLLVMLSLVMALNAFTRLEQIRKHNELMQQELSKLRQEYMILQEKLLGQPQAALPGAKKANEAHAAKDLPTEQLLQQLQALQFVLDAFRKQNEGQYPHNLEILIRFADRQHLQKMVQNPYTQTQNPLVSIDTCLDITHDPADEGLAEYAGRLLFQAHLDENDQATGYTLAAFDGKGLLLKGPDGQVLTLSHQL